MNNTEIRIRLRRLQTAPVKILLYTAQLANDKIVTYAAKSFS